MKRNTFQFITIFRKTVFISVGKNDIIVKINLMKLKTEDNRSNKWTYTNI